jgi:6-phosphogluconolactonase
VRHVLEEFDDADVLAKAAAHVVVEHARHAIDESGHFTFAVSGGRTPWAMFAELATLDMPWERTVLYQVDERVAPDGDPDRNLTNLRASLASARTTIDAMDVESADLDEAAARYAQHLPERLDLVHLGLGPDGHTASLLPGDPVLAETRRLVAVTGPYQGHRRMTLTYPGLACAVQILWLVSGSDKQAALASLLAGDESIPAGRVQATNSLVMADRTALAA